MPSIAGRTASFHQARQLQSNAVSICPDAARQIMIKLPLCHGPNGMRPRVFYG
jgi:hypothetical protein